MSSINIDVNNFKSKSYFIYFSIFYFTDTNSTRLFKLMIHNKSSSLNERYKTRANHLKKTCSFLQDRVKKIQYREQALEQEIYKMGDISICVLPKSGCSFLKRLIYYLSDPQELVPPNMLNDASLKQRLLTYTDNIQQNIFNLTRLEIHHKLDFRPLQISNDQFKKGSFQKVIVARNPYTRLFSAYIDKVFVPMLSEILKAKYMLLTDKGQMVTKSQLCSEYVSFEDFLEIVISQSQKSEGNKHWLPTSALCSACEVHPDIIIKQETYHEDVHFFLSQTDMNETQWNTINSVIASQGIQTESITRGLIKTMYFKGLESGIDCFSKIEIAQRVWEALKIQGQIYQFLEFPADKIEKADTPSTLVIADIFLKEMKKMPITAEESRNQRQRALARAYRHIRPELIIQIQAMFYYDFMIFQYDFNPPK